MATVKFKAHKHHKKADGTINIKLVVYHKGERSYPDTDHYVVEKQLTKKYEVKDPDLNAILTSELGEYRMEISKLGRNKLNLLSAAELGELLLPDISSDSDKIDFISFGKALVSDLKEQKRFSYAGTLQAVINNLLDFKKTDVIFTQNITSELLMQFEDYLRKPHIQTRLNQFKAPVDVRQPAMGDAGIFATMKNFRILYKAAMSKYNNLETGELNIKNYPFANYKLIEPPEPVKRALEISYVKEIINCKGFKKGGRGEMAHAVFLISLYLCGMNAIDIYNLNEIKDGRVSYNRSKTKDKRSDKAYISIKIIPEVSYLLDQWLGKLSKRYSTPEIFRKAVAEGLKQVALKIQADKNENLVIMGMSPDAKLILFDFYSARHTVGNEAYNTLGFTEAEVGEVLNHTKPTITASYIKKMWVLVDKVQESFVGLLK